MEPQPGYVSHTARSKVLATKPRHFVSHSDLTFHTIVLMTPVVFHENED